MDTADPVSLPGLQRRLDGLDIGEELTIPGETFDRLFGDSEAGRGRLANFAAGHGCTARQREGAVTFCKTGDGGP